MRTRKGLVWALLALTLAGCGTADDGDGVATADGRGKASSSATADGLTDRERVLKFAKCMRENGVPDFPDPEIDEEGRTQMKMGEGGTPREKVDAAMQKCKKHLPNGGEPPKPDPEQLEKLRKYAKCMRENGVPDFPDPDPDGGLRIDGDKLDIKPDDPRFQAAEKACAKYGPDGRRTERRDG